jgi:nicotinamide-nucleotide amidase
VIDTELSLLAAQVLAENRAAGRMVATAESCTGGLVAAALTDIAGSSDVFDRGFVTYSYAAKTDMLGVTPELLAANGAVSEAVALAMAVGALAGSRADAVVAITGIAGPGGATEGKPVGMVVFAAAVKGGAPVVHVRNFPGLPRAEVRRQSALFALELLRP